MASREDIGARRIGYTRRCGWVDWGHAEPGGARKLLDQIRSEHGRDAALQEMDVSLEGKPAYLLTYGQGMGKRLFGSMHRISTDHPWVVRTGLTARERESVALAIFLTASQEFERLQGQFLWLWITRGSSFSVEDLVSNLIGFYAACRGYSVERLRQICGEVSLKESYRIWDRHTPNGISQVKNHSARPVLYPTIEGVRSPANLSFPMEFTTITPAPHGVSWIRPERGEISRRLVDRRAKINVLRDGRVIGAAPGSTAIPVRSRR